MALILAIQPDERQAAILSGVVMNQLRADLVLVDSKDAALARIRKQVPDLILLAAELGRPDDEEFASRLRKIKNAEHLRTLSMPSLGSSEGEEERSEGGLLRAFKRKRVETRRHGRNPNLFAKELKSCLRRAERTKADRLSEIATASALPQEPLPEPFVEPTLVPSAEAMPAPAAEPTAVARVEPPAAPAAPVAMFDAIETRVAMSMRTTDAADAGPRGDADAIIRTLRVPPWVAGFAYPHGCRIGHIRLAQPPRPTMTRRPAMEPPPAGVSSRYEASL